MYKVQYQLNGHGDWRTLTDTYESLPRAATIATALENRGHTTRIIPA